MTGLRDSFGRELHYLRLSVTDRCNFRCTYCLPNGCHSAAPPSHLSLDEIGRLAGAFAALGFWKVRLTGGEPTTRTDIAAIVRRAASTPGVRRVGLTTNGYRLAALAPQLRDAGLWSLNISVDSLDPRRFEQITGSGELARVVAGVEAALAVGIPSVKVNVVALRGLSEGELDRFLGWTREHPLQVRFIELMRVGENDEVYEREHLPAREIRERLERRGWGALPPDPSDGPAIAYAREGHSGRAGIIAPSAEDFCERCNRLRVSSSGALRLCLFGGAEIGLRHLLRSDAQRDELVALIRRSAAAKPVSRPAPGSGALALSNLAAIGG